MWKYRRKNLYDVVADKNDNVPPLTHELHNRQLLRIDGQHELSPSSRFISTESDIMPRTFILTSLLFCVLSFQGVSADSPCTTNAPDAGTKLPLVFCDDFQTGTSDNWSPGDPNAWKMTKLGDNFVFEQFQQSKVKNPVRSPFNRCLIKDVVVENFVLDLKFQSTKKDYGHRDLCLFFGFQDPSHHYYVHFGKKTDDHANQIFIVNDKPRSKISTKTTGGTDWDDEWHHARIKRDTKSGTIEIYFDDMQTPVMTATDRTFTWGQVGIGSFDDTGRFDDVYLFGRQVANPQ